MTDPLIARKFASTDGTKSNLNFRRRLTKILEEEDLELIE
jgi:hypothetical protein